MRASASSVSSSVSGRVQTARGVAIEGVRVCAVIPSAECCADPACTHSDRAGAFALQLEGSSSPTLLASHPNYLPVTRNAVDVSDGQLLVLTMARGGAQVTGSVLDAEGGPVAGAELRATDTRGQLLALGASGADGAFRLDVVPGTTRILARADGYSEELRGIEAPLAGLTILLTAGSSVTGRVIAEDTGVPVGNVLVTLRREDGLPSVERPTRSLPDGTFQIVGLRPGRYSVSAVAEHLRSDPQWLEFGLARAPEPIEIVVRAAAQVSGVVQLGSKPCADGLVTLEGPLVRAAQAEADGSVTFDAVPPGQYQVSISCEGAREIDTLEVGREDVTRLWNLDSGARVTGVALSSQGKPLPDVQVNVNPIGPPDARRQTYCVTDQQGEFACSGLAPGDYEVLLAAMPARTDSVHVQVSSEAPARVVFRTHEEGAIRVRIEGSDSFDPATFSVIAKTSDGVLLPGQLRGDTFSFDPLPLGRYEIFCDGHPQGTTQQVELARDGEVAELTLALPALHTLNGRVVDDTGLGVPEVWVRAVREQNAGFALPTEAVLTDDDGAFSLSGLVPGRYTLHVSGAEAEGRLQGVASDGRQVIVRTERFGLLSGTLRSADGASVTEFVVSYSHEGGSSQGEVAGARGIWSLPSLPPGTYQLSARAAEGTAKRTVQLPAGGELSVALQIDRPLGDARDPQAAPEPTGESSGSAPIETASVPALDEGETTELHQTPRF